MDEGTLNDLLECSVCLERLDTSSKVLPCQHTFCKKCLQDIYQRHKELRCPECRIIVTTKIEDLPPNVLLMRLLEGMKNSGVVPPPKRAPKPNKSPSQHSTVQNLAQQHLVERSNNKHSGHVIPHQPYAKALYDYISKDRGDLSFKKGDIIILKRKVDPHWYQGECGGKQGLFPLAYIQIITPVPSDIPQCKALYDFRMNNDEEEGCLAFKKTDIINVIRRVDENWAEGKLDGRIGIFPLAFVEMNSLARSLMKLSTNVQPGPSKVAPPTPTAEDTTPLIPTDHSTLVQNVKQGHILASDSSSANVTSSSSSSTPNISSSNTSSSSSTAPSSPASPPTRNDTERPVLSPRSTNISRKPEIPKATSQQQAIYSSHRTNEGRSHHHQHNKEKRHSAEIVQSSAASQISTGSDRSKRSAPSALGGELKLPATFMALYPYQPQKYDELELKKGGVYIVTEICQDGWYKGTSNRTQKCGVFPGNYVTPARGVAGQTSTASLTDSRLPVSFTRSKPVRTRTTALLPPELPPRANVSPGTNVWAVETNTVTNALAKCEKNKDRKEKSSVSLMRRLASMKRSKSPPASSYSMDNPVFEDSTVSTSGHSGSVNANPVHVRSGSCPSQLLQLQPPVDHHRLFGSSSHRIKHKDRPSILTPSSRTSEAPQGGSSGSSPDVHRHKKSHSLDAGAHKSVKGTSTQTVRERFRCIAPYPPNSEYELELQVNDIIYVHKKREDGWYKGTQQRTGKTGLFPASFVESF
ncbi:E3 ubiquitin-protein ligase SH3RF3 isoform X3 [Anthonomus grandis grandis]|uniref:E3 ubiquitin-protein ligase SH3RF3 isoform X3 n=1 Tax=Anthonomus grandis grandis TaxID=2921223 RepID=UPI002165B039|nr:E3 ubiquitin-protein ligase SH3RF3 isoform X3 [Anthonomus grandis grandis]